MGKKSICLLVSIIVLLVTYSASVFARETNVELADHAVSAVLMERDSGMVLYEKNPDQKLPPASMTKMMTMLLIMEALEKETIKLDDKVRTSEYAASMGGSQIFLEAGEEMTVDELLKGIAIASGNDASVAMAEHIAGSNDEFVKMMNEKAKQLGLKNTNFQNATGLPTENHYSSAYDMALIAKELLKYDLITKYTSIYEDYLREDTDQKFWLVNTNRLVKFYPGVDGLKTGYTSEAKYCLTATAKRDGMRVIAVVMGAPTPKERNRQITKMLDYAFSQYRTYPVYERHHTLTEVTVSKGEPSTIHAVTSEDISFVTKKGENIDQIQHEVILSETIKAPLQKGDVIGKLLIKNGDKTLVESPIVADRDVKPASWWYLLKRTLGNFAKYD